MHEKSFDCVASCWIADFGIKKNFDGHVDVCVFVDVNMTEAIGMSEDRDAGIVLDVAHELV